MHWTGCVLPAAEYHRTHIRLPVLPVPALAPCAATLAQQEALAEWLALHLDACFLHQASTCVR